MRIGGIVLCGGQSKRMGRAKAWLPFGEELMLQRVVRILSEAVSPIVVVAAPEQDVPPLPNNVTIVRDAVENRGPLGGLAAGLQALQTSCDAAYLSSCDVPFLQPAFVQRMCDLLADNMICVPKVDKYHHPLAAVYCVNVLKTVQELLNADRLRPIFLFEKVPTRIVSKSELAEVDAEFRTLRNLNSPEDYELALREHTGM